MSKTMKDVPETLIKLVSNYSPSGQEAGAVHTLVERMQDLHFSKAFTDEAGNAVGIMGEGPRQIVLLGHIDTVPGEVPVRIAPKDKRDQAMDMPEGYELYGRGAVDAKGPLAAFVDAVAACGSKPGWQVVVIGAVGEEADSPGARHVVSRYQPEFAIIGEPSHWDRLTLGYKGSAWASLRVTRSMAHTAAKGESACEAAVRTWETITRKVDEINQGSAKQFERVQLTLRGMESGGDGFEEWAQLRVGARLPLDLPPEHWYEMLNKEPSLSEIPGLTIQPVGYAIPAFQGEKNNAIVQAFLASIRGAGGTPGFLLKTGTADMNIVAPAWGCPAVAYGPGDSALDHTPDEHIDLGEYAKSVEVIKMVLRRLTLPRTD